MIELSSAIEAILFAAGESVPVARLSLVLGMEEQEIIRAAEELAESEDLFYWLHEHGFYGQTQVASAMTAAGETRTDRTAKSRPITARYTSTRSTRPSDSTRNRN